MIPNPAMVQASARRLSRGWRAEVAALDPLDHLAIALLLARHDEAHARVGRRLFGGQPVIVDSEPIAIDFPVNFQVAQPEVIRLVVR